MQQLPTMPGMAPLGQAVAQAAPVATAPVAPTVAAPAAAPATPEVEQLALPADFNIAAFAITKVASTGTARKKPYEECTIEELRDRVTFRDVQGPNKDGVNYHMRPALHPKTLDIACLGLTDPTAGTPCNTIVVPLAYKDSIEDYVKQLVTQGYFDAELQRAVAEHIADKAAKELEAKKAPVNTAAADNALAELQAAPAATVAPVEVAQSGVAPVQAMPASLQQAAPAAVAPAMPGMPSMPGMPTMG